MAATSGKCNKLDCGSAKCLSAHDFYFYDTLLQMLPALAAASRRPHHTINRLSILECTMKSYLSSGLLLVTLGSALAGPSDQRAHMVSADTPVAVVPITADETEPRSTLRLRDALRRPFDDMDDTRKPYRLSVEERQRLREQLRDQPHHDFKFKP
jgi:hypothetical protein